MRRKSEIDVDQNLPVSKRGPQVLHVLKGTHVPQEFPKATIKPMGVPLETEQADGVIQEATGNEMSINGEGPDPEQDEAWTSKVNIKGASPNVLRNVFFH